MNCMKCGRETPAEQVFCEECLLEMEKYPVKPGTVVFLPTRKDHTVLKKPTKKRIVSLEEQVRILKKRVRVLITVLLLCVILILAMLYPTVQYLREDHFKLGQNYTSITVTTAPTQTPETIAD